MGRLTDKEYCENVGSVIEMLLKNAANCFDLDMLLINETAVETVIRLKGFETQ